MKSIYIFLLILLIVPVSCNVIDQEIKNVVDFVGIFETDQGWIVELDGYGAEVISLKPNAYPAYREVGDVVIIGATPMGNNTWQANVRGLSGFFEHVEDLKIENGKLTFTTGGTPRVWNKYEGNNPSIPNDDDEGDDPQEPSGPTTIFLDNNLYGDQESKKVYSFSVPNGTKKLEVILEENNDGRQLADMFVRRGSQPSVTRHNYTNKGWTADCASVLSNRAAEQCVFANPASGTWYVLVYGFHAYDGTTLKVRLTK
jgi:hypothetical protein